MPASSRSGGTILGAPTAARLHEARDAATALAVQCLADISAPRRPARARSDDRDRPGDAGREPAATGARDRVAARGRSDPLRIPPPGLPALLPRDRRW